MRGGTSHSGGRGGGRGFGRRGRGGQGRGGGRGVAEIQTNDQSVITDITLPPYMIFKGLKMLGLRVLSVGRADDPSRLR